MNPKGDSAIRRSLLVKKIFMSLTLQQILSNSALAFCLVFPLKSCRNKDFFFGEAFFFVRISKKKAAFP